MGSRTYWRSGSDPLVSCLLKIQRVTELRYVEEFPATIFGFLDFFSDIFVEKIWKQFSITAIWHSTRKHFYIYIYSYLYLYL